MRVYLGRCLGNGSQGYAKVVLPYYTIGSQISRGKSCQGQPGALPPFRGWIGYATFIGCIGLALSGAASVTGILLYHIQLV
jgi:hypothetical protein